MQAKWACHPNRLGFLQEPLRPSVCTLFESCSDALCVSSTLVCLVSLLRHRLNLQGCCWLVVCLLSQLLSGFCPALSRLLSFHPDCSDCCAGSDRLSWSAKTVNTKCDCPLSFLTHETAPAMKYFIQMSCQLFLCLQLTFCLPGCQSSSICPNSGTMHSGFGQFRHDDICLIIFQHAWTFCCMFCHFDFPVRDNLTSLTRCVTFLALPVRHDAPLSWLYTCPTASFANTNERALWPIRIFAVILPF